MRHLGPRAAMALGVLVFAGAWLVGHLLQGSSHLDAQEAFNAAQAWVAMLTVLCLVGAAPPPGPVRATAALAPFALMYVEAQALGLWVGVPTGAQWLVLAFLGQGLGALESDAPAKPEPSLARAAVAWVVGVGLTAFVLKDMPQYRWAGAAAVGLGLALFLTAPNVAPAARRSLRLAGLLAPLALSVSLFMLPLATPIRARLVACTLAFVFGWAEARREGSQDPSRAN